MISQILEKEEIDTCYVCLELKSKIEKKLNFKNLSALTKSLVPQGQTSQGTSGSVLLDKPV